MNREERRRLICAEVIGHIRMERLRRGISMNALAGMAGLSQSMVSRLEGDPKNPTLDSLLRLAETLQLDLGRIIAQAISCADALPPAAKSRRRQTKPKA